MSGLPIGPSVCGSIGIATGGTFFLNVFPSATANTKGTWIQATAATSVDTTYIGIQGTYVSGVTNTRAALDLGIGAGGSEVVIANNILCGQGPTTANININQVFFPCVIPANTRVAFRCQTSSSTTSPVEVQMQLFGSDLLAPDGYGGIDAIGFSAASTRGVSIASTTTQKGPWGQLTAASTRDYSAIFVALSNFSAGNNGNVDIGVGSAGNEVKVVDSLLWTGTGSFASPIMPVQIPTGTRVAARSQAGGAGPTFDAIVYGLF